MFRCEIEVRYYETDMQGIVHHSNYLRYLEVAREKFMREFLQLGSQDFEKLGVYYVIRDAKTTFLKPIRFGEQLVIKLRVKEYNGLRLVHEYKLCVNGEERATAETMLISIDKSSFKPLNMKKKHKEIHERTIDIMNRHKENAR